jgi:hypothetical protein
MALLLTDADAKRRPRALEAEQQLSSPIEVPGPQLPALLQVLLPASVTQKQRAETVTAMSMR